MTLIYASLKRILNKEVKQDELPEYLQGAFKQANQMKDIINIVLDARKMEVGQEVLHISSARIAATVESYGIQYTRLNYVKIGK